MTAYELGVIMGSQPTGTFEKDARFNLIKILQRLFGRAPRAATAGGGSLGMGSKMLGAPTLASKNLARRAAERAAQPSFMQSMMPTRGAPTRRELMRSVLLGTMGGTTLGAGIHYSK